MKPLTRDIVAVDRTAYKASDDFVFFGRDKNDNNNERIVLACGGGATEGIGEPECPGTFPTYESHDGTCRKVNPRKVKGLP